MADETLNNESATDDASKPPDAAPSSGMDENGSDAGAVPQTPLDDQPSPEQALDAADRAAHDISRETGDADSAAPAQSQDGDAFQLDDFQSADAEDAEAAGLNLLDDIDLQVTIELGRTRMYIEDVLRLNENSVVELDKAAGDSVDIFVNDRLVARGEVLVLNENFCVRISEIISQQEAEETSKGQKV